MCLVPRHPLASCHAVRPVRKFVVNTPRLTTGDQGAGGLVSGPNWAGPGPRTSRHRPLSTGPLSRRDATAQRRTSTTQNSGRRIAAELGLLAGPEAVVVRHLAGMAPVQ